MKTKTKSSTSTAVKSAPKNTTKATSKSTPKSTSKPASKSSAKISSKSVTKAPTKTSSKATASKSSSKSKTTSSSTASHKLNTEDRRQLRASDFGIPESREYPMPDAQHVHAAESYFHYASDKEKAQLAHRIMMKAKKFGVKVESDTVRDWAKKFKN